MVGRDIKGNALFVTPVFNIPTACSKLDTCSSNRKGSATYNVDSRIANYVSGIDVNVQDSGGGNGLQQSINNGIKGAYGTYNNLPPEVQQAILQAAIAAATAP